MVVVEHQRGLHVVSERTHLCLAKEIPEQRENALARGGAVGEDGKDDARRQCPRYIFPDYISSCTVKFPRIFLEMCLPGVCYISENISRNMGLGQRRPGIIHKKPTCRLPRPPTIGDVVA